jgi:hypothetical protein
MIENLIKGADVSSLLEVEAAGGRFFDWAAGNRQQATEQNEATGFRQTSPACRGGGPASRPVEGWFRRQSPSERPVHSCHL